MTYPGGDDRVVVGRFCVRAWLASLLLAASACADPLGPAEVAGTYALQSAVSIRGTETLLADTIILLADRTGHRRAWVERMTSTGPLMDIQEATFSYDIRGRSVELPLIAGAFTVPEQDGWYAFSGSTLVGETGYSAIYRRLDPDAP